MENELIKIFEDVAGSVRAASKGSNLMTPAEFADEILKLGDPMELTAPTVTELKEENKYVTPESTAVVGTGANYNYSFEDKEWELQSEIVEEDLATLNNIVGDTAETPIEVDMSDEQIDDQLDRIIGGNE